MTCLANWNAVCGSAGSIDRGPDGGGSPLWGSAKCSLQKKILLAPHLAGSWNA